MLTHLERSGGDLIHVSHGSVVGVTPIHVGGIGMVCSYQNDRGLGESLTKGDRLAVQVNLFAIHSTLVVESPLTSSNTASSGVGHLVVVPVKWQKKRRRNLTTTATVWGRNIKRQQWHGIACNMFRHTRAEGYDVENSAS